MVRDTKKKAGIVTRSSGRSSGRSSKKDDEKKKVVAPPPSSDESDDEEDSDDEEQEEMDVLEYRKFLSSLFPSKNIDKKVKAGEKLKKAVKKVVDDEEDDEQEWETEDEEEEKKPKKKIGLKKKTVAVKKDKKKKKVIEEDEEEDESDSEYVPSSSNDEDDDEDDDDDDEDEDEAGKKVNIILTIGGMDEDYDEDDDYDDSDDDEDTEDEDASVSSDDESEEEEDSDEDEILLSKKKQKKLATTKKVDDEPKKKKQQVKVSSSKADQDKDIETLAKLKEIYDADKTNKSIENCINMLEDNIKQRKEKEDKKQRKYKDKNLRIFKKILKDKNMNDDFSFYDDLDVNKQNKIIKELREINKITRIERPYRMTLLESDIPVKYKGAAMKKINALRYMEPGNGDYYKLKTWVDTFMKIPFNKYNNFPITIDDGIEKCHEFMAEAQKTLDDAVYGLNDAKMQVMQLFGQLLANPKAVGTAIGIHGPPGTGKTSLIKEGISKILKRPFAFVALGGAQDSSFLEGHSITYEGSVWGRIAQAVIDAGSMDVVFLFDEVDKISETAKGEEINGILTHLIDTTQNDKFHDKYFAEVEFDLSRCLFIFSYNDEKKVNPILRDRMYRIQTKGYVPKEKVVIANDYLLPKIREQVKFKAGDIVIPDDTLNYIIDNYCEKEEGVRNMKRCLEIIHTKMNLYRLMRPGSNLFGDQMTLKVEFPFKVTKDVVDSLIKKNELAGHSSFSSMYV
jgi:ATP-dependent Lon protease